jgi:hypothetical protein
MANAWWMFTGSAPGATPHSLFATFVDCAWSSAEDLPNVSWDQAIRDLAKSRKEYEECTGRFLERPEVKAAG